MSVREGVRTVAVIQARMSSTRFPGKVLAPLGGLPMIGFMAARAGQARTIDQLVVAPSVDASDDPLAEALAGLGIACVRGDLHDVLARFATVAVATEADIIVRLTGDCPLVEPGLIDAVVAQVAAGADYASNVAPPTYPDGLDVEAFTRAALDRAVAKAKLSDEREHVTLWMRRQDSGLRQAVWRSALDLSALRWTVDYPADLERVRRMVTMIGAECAVAADRFDFLRAFDQLDETIEGQPARNEALIRPHDFYMDLLHNPGADCSDDRL